MGLASVPPIMQPVPTFNGVPGGKFTNLPLDTPFEVLSEVDNLSRALSVCGQDTRLSLRILMAKVACTADVQTWMECVQDGALDRPEQSTVEANKPSMPVRGKSMLKLLSTYVNRDKEKAPEVGNVLTKRRCATVDAAYKSLNKSVATCIKRQVAVLMDSESVSSEEGWYTLSLPELETKKAAKKWQRRIIDLMLDMQNMYREATRELRSSKQSSSNRLPSPLHDKNKGKGIDPANFGSIPEHE